MGRAIRDLLWSEGRRIPVILTTGEPSDCDAGELNRLVGDLLVEALTQARDQQVFERLPKAQRCEMAGEQLGGGYGWPVYEDRGVENLA
jgi:hypothetical protein